MTSLIYVRYLLLCYSLSALVNGQECPFQECHCVKKDIVCQELGLTAIPPLTDAQHNFKYLRMETNNITTIRTGALPSNLTEISLLRNPIVTIDANTFADNLNTLESLSFSEAHFTRIPDALLHLRALKSLNIYDTVIQDWNVDVMKNIASTLEILYLVNVSMNTWPTWMQYFSHLTELSLDSNSISLVPDDAFNNLANSLTSLSFASNNLMMVPKAFSNLTALESLYLGSNKILDVTWLPQTSKMSILSLLNNNITDAQQLSRTMRRFGNSLISLDVLNNQLTKIPDLSFLMEVDYLDFTQNQISDPSSGNLSTIVNFLALDYNTLPVIPRVLSTLPSLHAIQMTYNLVTEIRGADIPHWTEDIELGFNLITELTDTSFPDNSSILSLNLVSNPIVKISQNAFKNLQRLQSLNMQNTKLTRLPLALTSLTSLTWVDVEGSRDLVCTCNEKSLGSWFLSRQTGIGGNCGETSIYVFFANLSQACP